MEGKDSQFRDKTGSHVTEEVVQGYVRWFRERQSRDMSGSLGQELESQPIFTERTYSNII
jgi:hypothetical protein